MADQEEPIPENELRAEDLNDEITRKYDPERLLKLIGKRAGKGESLDLAVRNKYEQRFGVDLGHVRIYSGEFAEEFNKKRDAFAVTVGATGMILMGGSPEKSMATSAGQSLLAHELTHVAQAQRNQGGGLHRKATFDSGMPFGEEHEVEAEEHEAAVQQESASAGAAPAGAKGAGSKESLEAATEKVKAKVLQMAADAARTYSYRNGSTRRP
ncbi:MAG: DUF4157 domain-containing protein [Deltaproteobacteria bacterium]|nr:DUF4157 domain-containing protein [Deltaproteobacteria bacterium]